MDEVLLQAIAFVEAGINNDRGAMAVLDSPDLDGAIHYVTALVLKELGPDIVGPVLRRIRDSVRRGTAL